MSASAIQEAVRFVSTREAIRASAKERKRQQRARQAERARISADLLAQQAETMAEFLAPKVLRDAVVTSDRRGPDRYEFHGKGNGRTVIAGDVIEKGGHMIVGPRITIIGRQAAHHDPVATMKLPSRHRAAAKRLRGDWFTVGAGCGVGAMDYLRSGGGSGDGPAGHAAMLAQIAARASLEGAVTFVGALMPVIARVVLDGIPVPVYAAEITDPAKPKDDAVTPEHVMATLRLALARLSLFYWPEPVEMGGDVPIMAFGPARSAYDVELGVDV